MHAHDTPTAFDAALDAIVERMRPSGGGLAQAFTPFPIVVGARWMETPIRPGLAQRHGVAANLVFLLVDDAVDRLVAPRDGRYCRCRWPRRVSRLLARTSRLSKHALLQIEQSTQIRRATNFLL